MHLPVLQGFQVLRQFLVIPLILSQLEVLRLQLGKIKVPLVALELSWRIEWLVREIPRRVGVRHSLL